jgi:hypothetical protein
MSNDHSSQRIKDNILIQEAIKLVEDGICVTFPVDGRSMLPFIIGGKDSVILEKPSKPEMGDIVLAWVDNCRYVVHRIIDLHDDTVILMGDGNIRGTEKCHQDDIKAKVTHVVDSTGNRHKIDTRKYRWGAFLWGKLRPVRRYLLFIYKHIWL